MAVTSEYADAAAFRAAVPDVDVETVEAARLEALSLAAEAPRIASIAQLVEHLHREAVEVMPRSHHVITPAAFQLFAQDVRSALAAARADGGAVAEQRRRACLRVISLATAHERRRMIEASVLRPLLAKGVDAAFHDAVDGRGLPLDPGRFQGGEQALHFQGEDYVLDCSAWPGSAFGPFGVRVVEELERRHAAIFKYEGPDHRNSVCKNALNTTTAGLVGGHLSHVAVWRAALERVREGDLEWTMILEDDAVPDPRLGLDWGAVWDIVAQHVAELQRRGEAWDIIYVGRYPSGTPEGRRLSDILVEPGYCCRTQTYCLSRRGLERLVGSGLVHRLFHCPQDEVLGSLIINDHINPFLAEKIKALRPPGWRALAFLHWGLTLQLMDVEESGRAESQVAPA